MNFQDVLGYAPLYEHPYSINTIFSNIKNDVGAFHPISDRLRDASIDETNLTRFKVNVYAESSDDKYRIIIGVVFFDNKPCIGYTISGRYGSDVDTYPFDKELFEQAIEYLKSFLEPETPPDFMFKSPQEVKIPDELGGHHTADYFEPDFKSEYKVGDEVWVWVLENHLKYQFSEGYKGYVLVKAEIDRFKTHAFWDTFHGSQKDRFWERNGFKAGARMQYQPGKGMGCYISEALILGKVSDIKEEPDMSFYKQVDKEGFLPSDYLVNEESALIYTENFKVKTAN